MTDDAHIRVLGSIHLVAEIVVAVPVTVDEMRYRLARDTPYQGNSALGNERCTAALENHNIPGVDDEHGIRFDGFAQGFRSLHQVDIGS